MDKLLHYFSGNASSSLTAAFLNEGNRHPNFLVPNVVSNTDVLSNDAKSTSGELEENFTSTEIIAQILVYLMTSYVITITVGDSLVDELTKEKSLASGIIFAVISLCAMELMKLLLNASAVLKKDFIRNYWWANATLSFMLSLFGASFYYMGVREKVSSITYNSIISLIAIEVKILYDYGIFPRLKAAIDAFPKETKFITANSDASKVPVKSPHEKQYYHFPVMQSMYLGLLFCTANTSLIVLEKMMTYIISQSEQTEIAGIVGAFTLFGRIFVDSLFWKSGWFSEDKIHPHYASRILTMTCVGVLLQNVSPFQDTSTLSVFINVMIAFSTDLIVQLSGFGSKIDNAVTALFAKCAWYQQAPKLSNVTNNSQALSWSNSD